MTVLTSYAPVQYTGNGVTTVFAFPYKFFETTNLIVYLDGVVQSTGFTITGGMGDDGDVTFSVAPANGVVVTIELSLPYTQLDDYVENQAFPAETLEQGLDKAAIRDQQLSNAVTRSLKFAPTLPGSLVGVLPQPVNGKILIWSGSSGTIGNADVADISTSIDTVITSIANGDFLVWNGTVWTNRVKSAVPMDGAQATGSGGLSLKNNTGTSVLTIGAGGGTYSTFAGGVNLTSELTVNGNSASAGYIRLGEDSDNGTNKVTITPPQSIASDYTITLPSSAGTIALTTDITNTVVLLGTQTASGSATLNFTGLISATYDEYFFTIQNIVPATDGADLWLRTSTNNGSSFDSGASDYAYAGSRAISGSTANTVVQSNSAAQIVIADGVGNATGENTNGKVTIYNPLNTTVYKGIKYETATYSAAPDARTLEGAGFRLATADIDAIMFLMSSGNITSGVIRMYGVRKA